MVGCRSAGSTARADPAAQDGLAQLLFVVAPGTDLPGDETVKHFLRV